MPTVYLSTEHSEAELALAGRVAEALECSALYVTWSPRGYEGPDCEAVLIEAPSADPAPPPVPTARSGPISRALRRIAGFFAAPADVERERRTG